MNGLKLPAYQFLFVFLIALGCRETHQSFSNPSPSHDAWSALLKTYIVGEKVNYAGFLKDSILLDRYLSTLKTHHPNENWSREEKMAYWINAYNALTVWLILQHYPVDSIREIGPALHIPLFHSVWTQTHIEIEGISYSLDEIEHKILRKEFHDPRIHFAINCASVSCPPLLNEAYTAEKLEKQLNAQARHFINNPTWNDFNQNPPKLSKLFLWYKSDFTQNGELIPFLNHYLSEPLLEESDWEHLEYNWALNDTTLLKTSK